MQRMYVSLSLALCFLSFQAVSAERTGDPQNMHLSLVVSDLQGSELNALNGSNDILLGISELSWTAEDNNAFECIKLALNTIEACKNFGSNDYDNCAQAVDLREGLWRKRASLLLKRPDDARNAYEIFRLLEFYNKSINPEHIKLALEKKFKAIISNEIEKRKLEIMLADFTNKRGIELINMLKPITDQEVNKESENYRTEKAFMKTFVENFVSYYGIYLHQIYVKVLKEIIPQIAK